MIRDGTPSIDALVAAHPAAHRWFGTFRSADAFALAMEVQDYAVMDADGCWLLLHREAPGEWRSHIFCPEGVNMPALRRLLVHAFDTLEIDVIRGAQPDGHPNKRVARIVARAAGGVLDDDGETLVLTRDRFRAYNADKL